LIYNHIKLIKHQLTRKSGIYSLNQVQQKHNCIVKDLLLQKILNKINNKLTKRVSVNPEAETTIFHVK